MPRVHTVDHGDTLFGLALKFYGDGNKSGIIAQANGIWEPFLDFTMSRSFRRRPKAMSPFSSAGSLTPRSLQLTRRHANAQTSSPHTRQHPAIPHRTNHRRIHVVAGWSADDTTPHPCGPRRYDPHDAYLRVLADGFVPIPG